MSLSADFFIQLAYALGVGILIGLERSFGPLGIRSEEDSVKDELNVSTDKEKNPIVDKTRVSYEHMGLRTFTVLSVTGFSIAVVGEKYPYITPLSILGISFLLIAMYKKTTEYGIGITTEVAAIGAFSLGILCRYNEQAAGVIALALTIILAAKRFTHQTIAKMRRVELTDTLKFLVVIFIALPLLPNRALDPYGAFNPYKVGFLVILISGISFVGYFLTRILGTQRGLGLTGVLGGLTSSTAVTAAMSAEAKRNSSLIHICAFSTVAANATMFVRVLVIVAVLDMQLVQRLLWSVGGMALVAGIASLVLWFVASKSEDVGREDRHAIKLKNPFSLGPALKFAALFVLILFAVRFSQKYFGDTGLYAAAALSGLADVDAITLSISEKARAGTLMRDVGAASITIAVVSNSVVKTGIAFYSGGIRFGRLIAVCLGAATVVGLGVAFLV